MGLRILKILKASSPSSCVKYETKLVITTKKSS